MSESDSKMSKSYIKQIIQAAHELNQLLNPEHDLEDWVDAKITRARNDLADVLGYLKYYPQDSVEVMDDSTETILTVGTLKNNAAKIIKQLKK